MTPAFAKRMAVLEAEAERLLAATAMDDPLSPNAWVRFLSDLELDRLEQYVEQQSEAGATVVDIPDDLYRRAIGRAVMGVDMRALSKQERDSQRLLRLETPAGDPKRTRYVGVTRDLVDHDVWHVDGRPASTMSGAEVAQLTASNPRP